MLWSHIQAQDKGFCTFHWKLLEGNGNREQFIVTLSLQTMTYLAQTLVFPLRQWVGICQQTCGLQAGPRTELRLCDFSRLRFALLSAPPCQSQILDPNTNNFAFSQAKGSISFWCKRWRHMRAGMTQIHLIMSFIAVSGCKMAYVWITSALWSETDLNIKLWQDKNVLVLSAHTFYCDKMSWTRL